MRRSLIVLAAALVAACTPKPPGEGRPDPEPVATAAAHLPDTCPARLQAPDLLPGVEPEHLELSWWLERMSRDVDLDAAVISPARVHALNASYDHPDNAEIARVDVTRTPDASALAAEVADRLAWMRARVVSGEYVAADGSAPSPSVLASLAPAVVSETVGELRRVEADVPVRCGPFAESLYTPALDLRFDRNNCSTLRAGELVRVFADGGSMVLARAPYTMGWIAADAALSPPLTVEEAEGLSTAEPDPLTRRALFTRAFEFLGTPYGWGGEGGGRDCSRFLMDLFEPFGIDLPRFSAHQARAGSFSVDLSDVPSEVERMLLVDAASRRGIVLLHFPGHIMLYLGRDDAGRPMAIHAFAEYLEPCGVPEANGDVETLFEVDRVTVSNLELGRGSSRTAFIERLTRLTVIGGTPGVELQGVAAFRRPAPLDPGEGASCGGDDDLFLVVSPRQPNTEQPLRAIAAATNEFAPVDVVFTAPDGTRHVPEVRRLGGPPYTVVAEIPDPTPGRWTVVVGEGGRVLECDSVRVASRRPEPGVGTGPAWDVRHDWSAGYENLYAAFVESLFDYPIEEDQTWTSLHALTRDPDRNLFYDYYGEREDEQIELAPDCADLPYMMRAYFAWKMGLPFGYRQCSRGRAGQPPRCSNLQTNLVARSAPEHVAAFDRFAGRNVRSGVHSASGRTHPEDDDTDFYPVALDRASLRPGTLYADPYGHLLVIAGWRSQGTDRYGVLVGADAQPDGTVGRRRFWRGSFLFDPDTTSVGAGFKAYRPVRVERSGEVVSYTNEMLTDDANFARYSLEQYAGSTDDFYARMEAIINPRPLDPNAMLVSLVDALDEAVARRLNSVDNGEAFMAARNYAPIEMPSGYSIFETTGPWEDFSTPARDMRLLISIDTVAGFPGRVRASPDRYGIVAVGTELDEAVGAIQARLDAELRGRPVTYTRSDGSTWNLTLEDVVGRAEAFEMSYNPNDCAEIRWGAPEGSDEYAPCERHAPSEQRSRMASYREWFRARHRPPR